MGGGDREAISHTVQERHKWLCCLCPVAFAPEWRFIMKLLLAEDELELSRALTAVLKHERYLVDTADNGEDALLYLESGQYDGAILDIMMPRMDGITVLKTIREKGNFVPVLLLTAKAEVDDRVLGLDSGADDYLTKPFSMRELLARVRAMLRKQEPTQNRRMQFGNLALDDRTYSLCTPSGGIRLTNKEYLMMEMLIRRPGQVISTQHFMETIWGFESEAGLHVVWVGISNLRRKLNQLHADVEIRVARGVGYSLEEING